MTDQTPLATGDEISLIAAEALMDVIDALGPPPPERSRVGHGAVILHALLTRHGFVVVPKAAAAEREKVRALVEAAGRVMDEYDRLGLVHVVDYEDLAEVVFAFRAALAALEDSE